MLYRHWMLMGLLAAATAWAANVKLYLKDGDYQLVREYKVEQDRIRYYSVERADWEELPLELVDLDRTRKEAAARDAELTAEVKAEEEETEAIRAERREIAAIPQETGVYWIGENAKLTPIKQADVTIGTDKKRNILKALSPIPMIAGKNTAEIQGLTAAFKVPNNRPEFYFRMVSPERMAIVQLTKKKTTRLIENISVVPVSNEMLEEPKIIATFKKQIGDQLFKIWPEQPLEPGEYAVMEYTDGAANPQVWDFSVGK